MQTHPDHDAEQEQEEEKKKFIEALEGKAKLMSKNGTNQITAGKTMEVEGQIINEASVSEWTSGAFLCRKMPDDSNDVLRISVGGGDTPLNVNYAVFRGDREKCVDLLRRALKALDG